MRDTCGCVRSAGVRQRVARLGPLQGDGGSGDVVPNGARSVPCAGGHRRSLGCLFAHRRCRRCPDPGRRPDCDVCGRLVLAPLPVGRLLVSHGAVVARAATAPKQDLSIPRRIVEAHPYAYHQTWIGSGADFNGYWDGEAILGRQQSIAERINRRLSDETGGDDDDGDDDGVVRRAGAGVTTVWHGRGAFYARAALSWCSGPWSGRRDSNPRPSPWQWLIEAAVETSHHLRGHQPARLVTARPHSGVDGRG